MNENLTMLTSKKILIITDSYFTNASELDTFRYAFINYLCSNKEVKVSVVKSNTMSSEDILGIIDEQRPNYIITINRNGITKEVIEKLPNYVEKIITWFVDNYNRVNKNSLVFCEKDYIFMFATGDFIKNFEKQYPECKGKVYYLPHFIDSNIYNDQNILKNKNILFLGTAYGGQDKFVEILKKISHNEENVKLFIKKINSHCEKYNFNLYDDLKKDFDILKEYDRSEFTCVIDDTLSFSKRINLLSSLSELGLDIYGIPESFWLSSIAIINPKLFKCFKYGKTIDTPIDLAIEYNKYKLAINIQHIQLGTMAVPTRCFEAMACKCLLLNPKEADNVMEELGFISGIDYVSYFDANDLYSKAKYYLEHEVERKQIVDNAYVKIMTTATLQKRIKNLFETINENNIAKSYDKKNQTKQDSFLLNNIKKYGFSEKINMFNLIELEKYNDNDKVEIIKAICEYYYKRFPGFWSSFEIENILLKIANKINFKTNNKYKKNSFLHVFTTVYTIGGHTRVAERWIENSNQNETHSVVLLSQDNFEVPQTLIKNIANKNGKLINLSKIKNNIEKAKKLRKIASNYEAIILHIHPNDPTSIVAFGNNNFKRPIIFFNHAEHLFGLGVSIADLYLDFRDFSNNVSIKKRGVNKTDILPLPIIPENKNIKFDKDQIFKRHGIEIDKKIILSIGRGEKYKPFGKYNFKKTILEILKKDKNAVCLIIGVDPNEEYWKEERIIPIAPVDSQKLAEYINCADLYIEAFPFPSFVALLDVAKSNVPTLSLKTPISHVDSISSSESYCQTDVELINKAEKILNGGNSNFCKLREKIKSEHYPDAFEKKWTDIKKIIPKVHKINYFNTHTIIELNEHELFCLDFMKSTHLEKNLWDFENKNKLKKIFYKNNKKNIFQKLKIKNRLKISAYGALLIIAQIPIIDLLLKKKKRENLRQKINKYWR